MSAHTRIPSHRPRRGILPLMVVGVIAFAAQLAFAPPAFAHDELVSSDPTAGAVLSEAPAQVTLTFSADLLTGEGATEVQVLDAEGTSISDGEAMTEGTDVTQPLAPELANGAYSVLWKVVSSDGHPTSGEFAFTVEAPVAAPSASPSESPSESAVQPSEPGGTSTPSASEAPAGEESEATSAVPWVVLGIIAAAVLGAVVYLLAARARRRRDMDALQAGAGGATVPRATESGDDIDR